MLLHIRSEHNGDVREGRGALPNHLFHVPHGVGLLLHQIPLVHHHHHATVALHNLPEDVEVLTPHGIASIEHQQAHVTFINGFDRANRAVEFKVIRDLLLLPKSGRIHNLKIKPKHLVARVHAVSRRPRNVRDNVAFLPKNGVDERALAHIGLSHHCQLGQPQLFLLRHPRHCFHHSIKQLPRPVSIVGADPINLICQSQPVKLLRTHIVCRSVHLVAHQHDRLACATQEVGNVLVQICDAHLNLHHEENQIRLLQADLHLTTNGRLKAVVALGDPPSRVNHIELMVGPNHRPVFPIARGATRVVRDRFSRLSQPIKKGGLAHIGPSDDGYEIVHGRAKFAKFRAKKKGPRRAPRMASTYSPAVAVPSALVSLTSLFGMGRGGPHRNRHLTFM